ncbi:MAG: prepilin peptidase [Gammaproteobacteria bacterium]|nr:MAG: prepilin peptidase [Gammaproteobacteria bacterium]
MQQTPAAFFILVFVIGLLVGSFLNVVIHRLPIIMQREFVLSAKEILKMELNEEEQKWLDVNFNLVVPRSRCPKCGHKISAIENIPVISYLFLGGKCSECKAKISVRYPIVEFVTAVLSLLVAIYFGVTWMTLAGLLLTWCLIALTMIDFDTQLLPDSITQPLIWLGLLLSMFGVLDVDLKSSIYGAVLGYLSLWTVYHGFKILTGKEGMGYGDFKLLAALGAWMGWKMLPVIILFSSFVGAVIGIAMVIIMGRDKNIPIPFGPYLAAAGFIALLWGDKILTAYLGTGQFVG